MARPPERIVAPAINVGVVAWTPSAVAFGEGTFVDASLDCSYRRLQIFPRLDGDDPALVVIVAAVAFACVVRYCIPCSRAWGSHHMDLGVGLVDLALLAQNRPGPCCLQERRPAFGWVSSSC